MALAALVGVTCTGLVPLGDSLTLGCVETDGVDYGRVRLWGSCAFIAASVGAGQTLTQVEPGWILWLIAGGVALTLAACAAGWPRSARCWRSLLAGCTKPHAGSSNGTARDSAGT